MTSDLVLTPEEQADFKFFEEHGYLVKPDFVSLEWCAKLQERALELVDHFDIKESPTIFSTKKSSVEDETAGRNRYFLDSVDKISFFFEEKAFKEEVGPLDPKDLESKLRYAKRNSINKIGHNLHQLDPVFHEFSFQDKIKRLYHVLGLKHPLMVQSMFIFKPPKIGGAVSTHQDNTYLYTEPQTCIGFWFALEDATKENGCLWAIPGGHKKGLMKRWVCDHENVKFKFAFDKKYDWEESKNMVPIEVKKGSLVVLHGNLPHMSYENTSDESRHAYTIHCVDGTAHWLEDNWMQRPKDNPFPALDDDTTATTH